MQKKFHKLKKHHLQNLIPVPPKPVAVQEPEVLEENNLVESEEELQPVGECQVQTFNFLYI